MGGQSSKTYNEVNNSVESLNKSMSSVKTDELNQALANNNIVLAGITGSNVEIAKVVQSAEAQLLQKVNLSLDLQSSTNASAEMKAAADNNMKSALLLSISKSAATSITKNNMKFSNEFLASVVRKSVNNINAINNLILAGVSSSNVKLSEIQQKAKSVSDIIDSAAQDMSSSMASATDLENLAKLKSETSNAATDAAATIADSMFSTIQTPFIVGGVIVVLIIIAIVVIMVLKSNSSTSAQFGAMANPYIGQPQYQPLTFMQQGVQPMTQQNVPPMMQQNVPPMMQQNVPPMMQQGTQPMYPNIGQPIMSRGPIMGEGRFRSGLRVRGNVVSDCVAF